MCCFDDGHAAGNAARMKQTQDFGYDLVQFTTHHPTCAICAIFAGRVFSLSGKDKRFPKLPDSIMKTKQIHVGCAHAITYYIAELQSPEDLAKDIEFSNRPFVDDRSEAEKELYTKQRCMCFIDEMDRENYKALMAYLPDIAPKSYSAYRRMRNARTKNYLKLVDAAKVIDLDIDKYR